MSRTDWARLGRAIRERREALGISQGAGDVSASTWRNVEHAVRPPYRRAKLLAIARVLGWTPDSIDLVLEGGDPVPIPSRDGTDRTDLERLDALEAELRELRTIVAGIAITGPSPEEIELRDVANLPADVRRKLVAYVRELDAEGKKADGPRGRARKAS